MIQTKVNEDFPITVVLLDEETEGLSSGQIVQYDVRSFPTDAILSPPVSGTLTESLVEPGIYNGVAKIHSVGNYIVYARCSGFITSTENITVDDATDMSDLAGLIKQTRHYNISVEDVVRTEQHPTSSQERRNVPKGRTDYIVTKIKRDEDSDWSGPGVVTGVVYAWYRKNTDQAPYRVGSEH